MEIYDQIASLLPVILPVVFVVLEAIFGKGRIVKFFRSPSGRSAERIAQLVFEVVEGFKHQYSRKTGSKKNRKQVEDELRVVAKKALKNEGFRASEKHVEAVIEAARGKHAAAKRQAKELAEEIKKVGKLL